MTVTSMRMHVWKKYACGHHILALTVYSDIDKHSRHLSVVYGCKTVTGDRAELSNRKKQKRFRLSTIKKQSKYGNSVPLKPA